MRVDVRAWHFAHLALEDRDFAQNHKVVRAVAILEAWLLQEPPPEVVGRVAVRGKVDAAAAVVFKRSRVAKLPRVEGNVE